MDGKDSIKKLIGEQALNQYIDDIMDQVYIRIAGVLTEQDINEIKLLDEKDNSGDLVEYFLINKVPNFYHILKEEINEFKNKIIAEKK